MYQLNFDGDNKRIYTGYRVGDYRIIAELDEEEIKIFIIEVGHGMNIY